jgi:hypothetical protein
MDRLLLGNQAPLHDVRPPGDFQFAGQDGFDLGRPWGIPPPSSGHIFLSGILFKELLEAVISITPKERLNRGPDFDFS